MSQFSPSVDSDGTKRGQNRTPQENLFAKPIMLDENQELYEDNYNPYSIVKTGNNSF